MFIYYVYAYLRKDGTPYYIGKGKEKRAWRKGKKEVKPPLDPSRIVIIEKCLSDIGAMAIERRLIAWYGRIDTGTGILRNRTDGGDGSSGTISSKRGIPRTQAVKQKLSAANSGKTISQEVREKISTTLKNKFTPSRRKLLSELASGENNPMFGKHHSEETKEKIRARVSVPVQCIQNGEVYPSLTVAARVLGLKVGDIANVLGNRQKTTKGYSFRYYCDQ